MATCSWCGKSGWLVIVDADGLCASCGPAVRYEVRSQIKELKAALKNCHSSRKPAVVASALLRAAAIADHLTTYESKRIFTTVTPPSSLGPQLRKELATYLAHCGEALLAEAMKRHQIATTDAARTRPFASVVLDLEELARLVPESKEVAAAIAKAKQALDHVQFLNILRKAELAEAQGKRAKAIDLLISAMIQLRRDATDDTEPEALFDAARKQLVAMGGTPPF